MKISISRKLNLIFISILSTITIFFVFEYLHIVYFHTREEAEREISHDLGIATMFYKNKIESIGSIINLTATRFFIREGIFSNSIKQISDELVKVKKEQGLDILNITDKNGLVLIRSNNLTLFGDDQSNDLLISRIISEKRPIAGINIIPSSELKKESIDLAKKAYIKSIETPNHQISV